MLDSNINNTSQLEVLDENIPKKKFDFYSFIKSNIGNFLSAGIIAYVLVSILNLIVISISTDVMATQLDFVTNINNMFTYLFLVVAWSVLFWVSSKGMIGKKILYSMMFISVFIFGAIVVRINSTLTINISITLGVSLVIGLFAYYIMKNGYLLRNKIIKDYKSVFIILVSIFILMAIIMTILSLILYKTYSTKWDLGIFTQLFENMAKTGSTVISIERNRMLSHFYNHFSPIYYILLIFYIPFRTPEALLAIQAVFVAASVFPAVLIGKRCGLTPILSLILGLIVLVFPGYVLPCMYDFHENKFLAFFLLWFIYFFISNKYIQAYIFMLLALMVKEDAVIYVVSLLIYFIIVKKNYKYSIHALEIALIYALPVMIYMQMTGLDFVGWRYGAYFLDGQSGIGQMIHNIILNPAFFIKNVFSDSSFVYVLTAFGSLSFIPLITKDFKKFILLIPLLAINLMSDFEHQHDIYYQYNYGSLTLLLYLYIDNLSELKYEHKKIILLSSLVTSFMVTLSAIGIYTSYVNLYYDKKDTYVQADMDLDSIPEDASITASCTAVAHFYNHDRLYLFDTKLGGGIKIKSDYYVIHKYGEESYGINEQELFENSELYSDYELYLDGSLYRIYKLKQPKGSTRGDPLLE